MKRIVDRYLEHGRIFWFKNNGQPEAFMGSADWMNRNIYSRIEVCFLVFGQQIKEVLKNILDLQLKENEQLSIYKYLEINNFRLAEIFKKTKGFLEKRFEPKQLTLPAKLKFCR